MLWTATEVAESVAMGEAADGSAAYAVEGREGLEGGCVDAVIEPGLVDRAQSGGRAEDVAGALAESSGGRAPYRGVDRIEHQGRVPRLHVQSAAKFGKP